ncbi:MAG: iron ABC transporter permease [Myxococcales bacterium]|nr:MAG: iron ABC transporter permease [Myxococcales bacterium]
MNAATPLRRLAPFALSCIVVIAVCPFVGAVPIDVGAALRDFFDPAASLDATILVSARLPRVLLAAFSGAALAAAGAAFQALLRNPLATPYTLGVASGGAFGAVLAIKLGLDFAVFGLSGTPLFAFAGALGTVALVYAIARARRQLPTTILLLAGVSLSFVFSALMLFVHYLADFSESFKMVRWLMGGLDIVGYRPLLGMLPLWLVGVWLLLTRRQDLDQLSFGDYLAHAHGVDVERAQRLSYLAASLLVSAVVSVAGPIGFVGLVVPHSVRFLIGPSLRLLMPACLFAGAAFLVLCDTAARIVIAPSEIPVGVLTALIGGPFFIGLLFREKRRMSPGD